MNLLTGEEAQYMREKFLEEIPPEHHFHRLFDHLPDLLFFVKNRNGALLFANEGLVRHYGFDSEKNFVGRTDFDLLPPRLAEKYREDDKRIIDSGQPMLNILELFLNFQGIPDWYVTNKLPVISRSGAVIGVMGTIHKYRGPDPAAGPVTEIGTAVDYLKNHFKENISVKFLAKLSALSVRQFERNFKALFNSTPRQFLIKTRIHMACDMLRDRKLSMADIGEDLGFYDQSAFSQHFKKYMGFSPLQYRKRFW